MPTTDWLMERECPACEESKPRGLIVCQNCLDKIHPQVRRWLLLTDVYAGQRRMMFYSRLAAGSEVSALIPLPTKKELIRKRKSANTSE